jgi:hypothetical protein
MRGAFTSLRQDYITRDRRQNRRCMSLIMSAAAASTAAFRDQATFFPLRLTHG